MSLLPDLTTVFLDTIIASLVPWFLTAAGGDLGLARHTARTMLASFDVATEEEMRLAAEIASFGFGALAALSKSVDPDLPLNAVLRLRGSANALQRSKNQCQRALDKLRKERRLAQAEATAPAETTIPPEALAQSAEAGAARARPSIDPAPRQPEAGITLSRQQRRAVQRALDKAQRKQAEQARRAAMRAVRSAAAPAAAQPIAVSLREPNAPPAVAAAV